MTFPLNPPDEPGESEFSHGKGMMASEAQRGQAIPHVEKVWPMDKAPDGPWFPRPFEQMKAVQRTDPAEANAVASYEAKPNTADNATQTQWVRE